MYICSRLQRIDARLSYKLVLVRGKNVPTPKISPIFDYPPWSGPVGMARPPSTALGSILEKYPKTDQASVALTTADMSLPLLKPLRDDSGRVYESTGLVCMALPSHGAVELQRSVRTTK